MNTMPELISTKEFARRTGYPLTTIRRLVRHGEIRALVEGRKMLLDFETAKADMENYVRRQSEIRLKSMHMYDSANCVPDKTGSRWRYGEPSEDHDNSQYAHERFGNAGNTGYPSACRMSPPSFQEQLQFVRKKLLGKW